VHDVMADNGTAGNAFSRDFAVATRAHLTRVVPELQEALVGHTDSDESPSVPRTDGGLDAVLGVYTAAYPDADRRALISLWMQRYLQVTWIPLAVAAMGELSLPRPSQVRLRVDEVGRPVGIAVVEGEFHTRGPSDVQLVTLTRDHTAPVINWLGDSAGFSPRVGWNVVGAMHAWLLDRLSQVDVALATEPARRLLEDAVMADGGRNPLQGTRRGQPACGRRVCCLRYRLEDFDYCHDCPIPGSHHGS